MTENLARTKRWKHQSLEFQVGREKRSRMLIWPMRSGKTRACIDKACFQFSQRNIEGVIVIAPNGVHLNWLKEIEKWAWPTNVFGHKTFAWETSKRGFPEKEKVWREVLMHRGLKWFSVNMEALTHEDNKRAIRQFKKQCHDKFFLIVSEAHHFGHAGAKRTKQARSLAYHAEYVMTETGTPILTSPLRAFSQYELLAPGALGFGGYTKFKEYYADFEDRPSRSRSYKKVANYKNLDELTRKISKWSSLVLREELGDMPALVRTERPVVMSDSQRKAYLQMVAEHLAEIGDDEISAEEAGPRMTKLHQILSGYLIKDGISITVDEDAPIYEACIDEVKGTFPGKTLIWCRFKEDIRRLAVKLKRAGFNTVQYHGDLSPDDREANRRLFLTDDRFTVCIGTPNAGGEGLDFSAADAVIFFSAPPNARMVAQAEERATVKGGKTVYIVRMTTPGTVSDRIYQIIDGNIKLADSITGHGLRDLLRQTDI